MRIFKILKNYQTGFTLIEMLVVVTIFVLLISSSAVLVSDNTVREDLSANSKQVIDFLNRAHNYAVNAYYGDDWGVKTLNDHTDCYSGAEAGDCLVLYKGQSYASRNNLYDEILLFDGSVYLDAAQANEFYFERISGWLSTTTGELSEQTLVLTSNIGTQATVSTTPVGLVYQE